MPLPFHRRRLDPDAADFCRRSGATDRAAINAFVRGVKDLGLWESMVCWPLRSSQNAGNGDTVHSLGGLGTFNGTRVNGPAWTADGISADATNETISLPASPSLEQIRSGLAAFKTTSNALNQRNGRYVVDGSGAGIYWQLLFDGQRFANQYGGPKPIFTRNGVQSENFDVSGTRAINLSQFQTNAFTADDSTDNAFVNGVIAKNGARTGLSAINPTGTANARELLAASSGMTQAAVMLSTAKWSNDQVLALHTLYRNTLGAGLGLPDYDPATIEFANRSGATDLANINAFVRGVKDLGLWNNMVCWPLRSSQNAGTGTTAYSLGGLGTYDGTLVNDPAWGADGLDFDGSDDRVTLPNGSFGTGNAATSIWAFLKNETNAARMIALSQGNNNSSTDSFAAESPSSGLADDTVGMAFTGSIIATKSTAWKSLFIGNTSAGFRGKDGGTVTEFSLNNALNKSGTSCAIGAFGNPAGVGPFDGLIAAVIRINATPTTALNGQIHDLYKQTLGTGLGLP